MPFPCPSRTVICGGDSVSMKILGGVTTMLHCLQNDQPRRTIVNRNLKTASAIIFMGAAVLLAGCSSSYRGYNGSYAGPGGKHTIQWYEMATNNDARHKEYQWCEHRPEKYHWSRKWLRTTAGVACWNAEHATWSKNPGDAKP